MRLMKTYLLATVAVLAIALPAPAQLVFEWRQIPTIAAGPATGPAVTNLVLTPGDIVFLQLQIRDTNPAGSFPWAFGDGTIPPPTSNFDGVGLFSIGAGIRGTPGVFAATGNGIADRRLTAIPDAELPAANQGLGFQPYATATYTPTGGGFDFAGISGLADGNPFENGDFPRVRPGNTAALMPVSNFRFQYTGGSGTLTLVDAAPGATNENNQVGGPGAVVLATLDAQLFSTAPTITITPVPEPSSFVLAGMAVAGLWKIRRRKTVA